MGGDIIGLVAVIMSLGVPLGALYTYYRVRKLRRNLSRCDGTGREH